MSAQPEFYFMQCLDIFKLETPNGISESRERAKVRVSVFFRNPIECRQMQTQLSQEFLTVWRKKAKWGIPNRGWPGDHRD